MGRIICLKFVQKMLFCIKEQQNSPRRYCFKRFINVYIFNGNLRRNDCIFN